ncbi:MAG: NYN domain-containing protein [Candidatus Zixiibacteriota bacterium]
MEKISKRYLKKYEKIKLSPNRVSVYIDGFNVYHFLDRTPGFNKYKWLDYSILGKYFLPENSEIKSIYYFTALAKWAPEKIERHQVFIRALNTRNVKTVLGKFKSIERTFIVEDNASKKRFKVLKGWINGRYTIGYTFEEKKTDVNIAIQMLHGANADEYDTALLMSGDTDFEPIIKLINMIYPQKKIILAVPNRKTAGSLRFLVGKANCKQILKWHLESSQLPDRVPLPNGKYLTRPESWK